MISTTAEYALRAIVFLATRKEATTVREIAAGTKAPTGSLSKVLHRLGRAGLVYSQRGLGGGFRMRIPAEELTVLRVINAVDPLHRIHVCPMGIQAHGRRLCPLHEWLDEAAAAVERTLGNTKITEILGESTFDIPLCAMGVHAKRSKRSRVACHPRIKGTR